jgi:hypothetical protein
LSNWRRPAARALAPALALALVHGAAAAQARSARVALTDVAVVGGVEAAEVKLTLTGRAVPRAMLLEQPWRLVLDFPGVDFEWRRSPAGVGGDLIREVRGSQHENLAARVVIELTRRAPWVIERTPAGVRVLFPEAARAAAPAPPAPAAVAPRSGPRPPGAPEVQGIIVRDDVPVAYIREPVSKQVRSYRVGDRVGDAVIQKIGEREVVFVTPAGPVEVRLEGPGR